MENTITSKMKNTTLILLAASGLLSAACGTQNAAYQADRRASVRSEETINTGYTRENKENSASTVSNVEFKRGSGYSNIYEYLRGRVAGLIVNNDNSITIRGVSSIYGSNEPLILVDGIEMSDISTIHPDDVKSVDVLKDPSVTSLYGSRGANGVILITLRHAD